MRFKKTVLLTLTACFFFGMAGLSKAALITIGTADYDDGMGPYAYKLIYDDNGPLGPVTWLDYTSLAKHWLDQKNWAEGIGTLLTNINMYPGYRATFDWSTGWRLPLAGSNPHLGYNEKSSEMGHLWYDEFGYSEGWSPNTSQLNAVSEFDNLVAYWYWTGTEYSGNPENQAWDFSLHYGYQTYGNKGTGEDIHGMLYGLAVHPGRVEAVPLPGAVWLLGSGMIFTLAPLKRARRKIRS